MSTEATIDNPERSDPGSTKGRAIEPDQGEFAPATLESVMEGLANLTAGMGLVGRHQVIIGEQIQRVLDALTPKKQEGPSVKELVEQLLEAHAASTAQICKRLDGVAAAIQALPQEIAKAVRGGTP